MISPGLKSLYSEFRPWLLTTFIEIEIDKIGLEKENIQNKISKLNSERVIISSTIPGIIYRTDENGIRQPYPGPVPNPLFKSLENEVKRMNKELDKNLFH